MQDVIVLSEQQIRFLCDRRFGIGADGLMSIAKDNETDFVMQYYNSDGNRGSMCGNGGRCIVSFAASKQYIGNKTIFRAVDGNHHAVIQETENNLVQLQMSDVLNPKLLGKDVELNTGSPHYVRFVESVEKINVVEEGRKIRHNDVYKLNGINVNFVEVNDDYLHIRTYERGVEDETLSCGTGVTASVIAASFTNRIAQNGFQKVKTPGGTLAVRYNKNGEAYSDVWLEGSTSFVYEGKITII